MRNRKVVRYGQWICLYSTGVPDETNEYLDPECKITFVHIISCNHLRRQHIAEVPLPSRLHLLLESFPLGAITVESQDSGHPCARVVGFVHSLGSHERVMRGRAG